MTVRITRSVLVKMLNSINLTRNSKFYLQHSTYSAKQSFLVRHQPKGYFLTNRSGKYIHTHHMPAREMWRLLQGMSIMHVHEEQ